MDKKIKRYYQLKQKQKEIEQELTELRNDITLYLEDSKVTEAELSGYRVKMVVQERKDYDDSRLYESLPDPDVWRLLSKSDVSKIASLVKLKVINEDTIKDSYSIKTVKLLHVEKK